MASSGFRVLGSRPEAPVARRKVSAWSRERDALLKRQWYGTAWCRTCLARCGLRTVNRRHQGPAALDICRRIGGEGNVVTLESRRVCDVSMVPRISVGADVNVYTPDAPFGGVSAARSACAVDHASRYACGMSETKLEAALRRSDELDAAVWGVFPGPYAPAVPSPRHDASLTAALMAVEHARATRLLITESMSTTGIGVQRLQFEALARPMWLLYAASEDEVRIATAPLTARAAKKADDDLPMAAEMVKALKGKTPPGADEMMAAYKDEALKPLHSFVHACVHPLRRHVEGYPEALLLQIIGNCNALLTMTGAMLAISPVTEPPWARSAVSRSSSPTASRSCSPRAPRLTGRPGRRRPLISAREGRRGTSESPSSPSPVWPLPRAAPQHGVRSRPRPRRS